MKIITQLVIQTLSLLLANAHNDDIDQYCTSLIEDFKNSCTLSRVTVNSCCDLRTFTVSRVFKINKGTFDKAAHAYCNMVTDGGGWIVIQRNKKNTLVDFNRKWVYYEKRFGNLNTEFWYGLEEIHCLIQRGQWEMRIDYQKNDKSWSYLHYNQFSVGSANEEYTLTVGGYSGSLPSGEALYFNGMKFSTPANDNDDHSSHNCAALAKSGNWYKSCYQIDLNRQPPRIYSLGSSLLFTEMKFVPRIASHNNSLL